MDQRPSKASILGALSTALDLVEGQVEGHALRTCLLALKLGRALQLSDEQLEDLFFAAVLKDSGCSNNSVRIQKIFGGDEILSKQKVKFIDWANPIESLKFAVENAEPDAGITAKLRRMASNLGPPAAIMNEVTNARCSRGALIAKKLNFRPTVSEAIFGLDEHWNGKGAPYGKKREENPLLARILCLAQTFEVFFTTYGLEAARQVVTARSKKWFDPQIVQAVSSIEETDPLWVEMTGNDLIKKASSDLPWLEHSAMETDIDNICEAFAMIIDAKSSFTAQHSARVTEYSIRIGEHLGFDAERLKILKRACLMHDVGKLGVPTSILEKPGKLDVDEFARIQLHPKFSDIILRRIPTFGEIAEIASAHHERLDGKGYWRGLGADQLSLDTRVCSACDVFDALTAKRPYRDALPLETVFSIMDKEAGSGLDPDCVTALKECYASSISLAA